MTLDLKRFVADAHAQAVKSGFWDEASNKALGDEALKVCLIVTEIAEAVEEYRLTDAQRGGALSAILFESPLTQTRMPVEHVDTNKYVVAKLKPAGFVVELADAAIRLADLCGRKGWSLEPNKFSRAMVKDPKTHAATLPFIILSSMNAACLLKATEDNVTGANLAPAVFAFLQVIAARVGGKLEDAIEIKMRYNATRPHLHGKAL